MNTVGIVLIAAIVAIVAGAVVYLFLRNRSRRLREHFGPEYSRAVAENTNRWRAESALEQRIKRVERLHIRALDPGERTRFRDVWRNIQARFVDNPNQSLVEADRLIASAMSAKGYPVEDFEQRASDISVDHPRVVENYRKGHRIALSNAQGRASTEDLRVAMMHYRALFEDLIEQPEYERTGVTL